MNRVRRKAFTLFELLVVISIIALMMSILLPSLTAAREAAKATQCRSNLHQMMVAEFAYATQNKDHQTPHRIANQFTYKTALVKFGFLPNVDRRSPTGTNTELWRVPDDVFNNSDNSEENWRTGVPNRPGPTLCPSNVWVSGWTAINLYPSITNARAGGGTTYGMNSWTCDWYDRSWDTLAGGASGMGRWSGWISLRDVKNTSGVLMFREAARGRVDYPFNIQYHRDSVARHTLQFNQAHFDGSVFTKKWDWALAAVGGTPNRAAEPEWGWAYGWGFTWP
jgi:prepilin-type N-terminal cleavage/methylation domain-containing protein